MIARNRQRILTLILAVSLIGMNTFILLDAFVLTKTYVSVQPNETSSQNSSNGEPLITSNSYQDENITLSIETIADQGVVYYVVDIQLRDPSYFKTAFANNAFGKNITESTSSMASENHAILAINMVYFIVILPVLLPIIKHYWLMLRVISQSLPKAV